jgi:hypothetical protein
VREHPPEGLGEDAYLPGFHEIGIDPQPPGVLGGQYYGPGGLCGARGYPKLTESSRRSHDTAIQRRLWTVSEELTGVTFPASLRSGK